MIPKEVITAVSKRTGIKNISLIEKDLYLHGLLLELSKSKYFSKNFVFKGGTCLTKAYFGYYRFSEDLDFTWMNQKVFANKSQTQIRKMLSKEVNEIMEIFELAAKKLELKFKQVKSDKHFVQLGGSGRFATFKFWYKPVTGDRETFIKIQLNFVDKIFHKPKKHKIKAIADEHKKRFEFLFPKHVPLAAQSLTMFSYDLKEIVSEKIRALLTRRGFKARDIVDLFVLSKKNISIKSVKKMAIEKTEFMLKYLKYAQNLKNKKFAKTFELGEEKKLEIKEPGKDFGAFANKALKELNELAEELRQKNKINV